MRVLALLFAIQAVACAGPLPAAPASDQAEIPLHYCLAAPQARTTFLASNPEALATEVVTRRVVVLNQEGWGAVRIARASSSEQCPEGEEQLSAEELQATLDQLRFHPEISQSCSLSFPANEDARYASRVRLFGALSGVRMGWVNYGSDRVTVTVQDDCSLVEPLVRAIEARARQG